MWKSHHTDAAFPRSTVSPAQRWPQKCGHPQSVLDLEIVDIRKRFLEVFPYWSLLQLCIDIIYIYDHIGSFQCRFKSLYSGIIWYPPQCMFKSLAPTVSSFGSWVFQSQIQAFLRHTAFAQQKWSNNVPLDRAESGRIHGHTAIPWKIRKAGMFPRCENMVLFAPWSSKQFGHFGWFQNQQVSLK